MEIKLNIPDDIFERLVRDGEDPTTQLLESIAVDAYNNDRITKGQAANFLGLGWRLDFDGTLKKHGGRSEYTLQDLASDLRAIDELDRRGTKAA